LDLETKDIAVADGGNPVKVSELQLVKGGDHDRLVTMMFDRLQPSAAQNAREITAKILKIVPSNGFSFSVVSVDRRLRLFQEFTSNQEAITKAVAQACRRDEVKQENVAAEPEKNLIAVAQTGIDSSGAHVSAEQRQVAQVMLASLEESQKIQRDQ